MRSTLFTASCRLLAARTLQTIVLNDDVLIACQVSRTDYEQFSNWTMSLKLGQSPTEQCRLGDAEAPVCGVPDVRAPRMDGDKHHRPAEMLQPTSLGRDGPSVEVLPMLANPAYCSDHAPPDAPAGITSPLGRPASVLVVDTTRRRARRA